MWTFVDKSSKQRPVCLIPEATALVQREYRERWSKEKPKPVRVFYVQRCYRYEQPQAGRYREFTQFGAEILGPKDYQTEAETTLINALASTGVEYDFDREVKRGLSYYTRDGFEARVDDLGAQKQIAGGGTYPEGCGWAVGMDRLVIALMKQQSSS